MNKGLIVINKPKDWTSFDVVNKLKRLLKNKRVGHLGTLDPMATGVLLVTFGSATKLFDLMQEKRKTYIAEFELGRLTDTLDDTGNTLIKEDYKSIDREQLDIIIQQFIGEIDQIPPKYSAKSIGGKRAYDLARQNIDFDLPAKKVTIHDIKLLDYKANKFSLEITCGSGTYIRSLGRDIARKLDTYATMTSLIRTKVGKFDLNNAISILDISECNLYDYCLTVNDALDYSLLKVSEDDTKRLLNGQIFNINKEDGIYKLNQNNETIAIIKIEHNQAKMSIFLG